MKTIARSFEKLDYIFASGDVFDPSKKYPTVLLVHGAGSRGRNLAPIKDQALIKNTEVFDSLGMICFAPQCYADTWFDIFEQLQKFVRFVINEPYVDTERIYFTGGSLGGYCTWQLAMTMPKVPAAIVPVCGGGMYWNAGRLKNIPVWAFHGDIDPVVYCRESEAMVKAVNNAGGNARLTVYPNTGHNAWEPTYNNIEVYKWMLSHSKNPETAGRTEFNDVKTYG